MTSDLAYSECFAKHNTSYRFAFYIDCERCQRNKMQARHRSADKIYCDVPKKQWFSWRFSRFRAEKDSGPVPKPVPFSIYCDVSVHLSTVTYTVHENAIFVQTLLTLKCRQNNKIANFEIQRLLTKNDLFWQFLIENQRCILANWSDYRIPVHFWNCYLLSWYDDTKSEFNNVV